jgi:hypothetical protein
MNPAQAPHVCHGLSWGECRRGLLPSTMGVGVIPYKIFENLHTKSYIMDAFHDYFPGHASFVSYVDATYQQCKYVTNRELRT